MVEVGKHHRKTPRRARWEWAAPICSAVLVSAAVTGSGWAVAELSGSPPDPPRAVAPPPPLVPVPPKPGPTIAPPTTTAAPTSKEVVPAEKAASPPAAPPKPAPPRPCPTELKGTREHVAQVGHHIAQRFDVPLSAIGGYRASAIDLNGHPAGRALDLTVNRATGDAIAAYALENRDRFRIQYVIWRQRINSGGGWEPMGDRGSITANHYDHVHLNFEASGPVDVSC